MNTCMRMMGRAIGCGLLACALLAIGGCGGGGSDNPSVMPVLLNGTSNGDVNLTHWQSNTGTGGPIIRFTLYQNGGGYFEANDDESGIYVGDDSNNTRSGYGITWDEPSGGTVIFTFVPDAPGFGMRMTSIVIAEDENEFTARCTAENDEFIDLTFTRENGNIDPR